MVGGLILKRANSPPRITARRGGGVTKKKARSLLMDAAGVVFLVPSIGTPPRPRKKRMLRNIFLIARPPLLSEVRGGGFAILKFSPCRSHHPNEAHLHKLGLRKSLRCASSAAETAICGGGVVYFEKSEFPSSHHREEGRRRHQEKGAKPPYGRRRGGVPCPIDRNTTPSSRKADAAQYFLDRSEFAILKFSPCAATPPHEAHLSKLGLQKSLEARRARPRQRYVVGGSTLKRANSPPRITARRGGGVTINLARSLPMYAAGVVFLVPSIGTPPRPREKRMLRNIFLIARNSPF